MSYRLHGLVATLPELTEDDGDCAQPCSAVAAENFVQSMTDQQFDDFVNAVEASPSRPKVALRPVTAR
jgi:hypothetical protein